VRYLIYIYISVDWCNQKTASLYTYQSTYAIRKRHIIAVLHISKPWKWGGENKNGKRGGCCVLSTSTCEIDHITNMKPARPWLLVHLKIIWQFHAHPVHQKVSRFFGPRYIGDDFFLGPNLVSFNLVWYSWFFCWMSLKGVSTVSNPNNPVVILRSRWSLHHPAIVPIEGAVLFKLPLRAFKPTRCNFGWFRTFIKPRPYYDSSHWNYFRKSSMKEILK
jgi:hypothetical protein